MSLIKSIYKDNENNKEGYSFYCPGCEHHHVFLVKGGNLNWDFNGSFEKPTFAPSLLNRDLKRKYCCHLFVKDGKIQFLNDCTHKFAGQTVDIKSNGGSYGSNS